MNESSSTTQAIAQGEDGRRNKFLLPSRLRLNERSSSTTQAIAQGEDERSSSTTQAIAKGEDERKFIDYPSNSEG